MPSRPPSFSTSFSTSPSTSPSTSRRKPQRLPAYALYGEAQRQPQQPDALHCESIAERSRLHSWEIKPHRHEALFQLLVIATGECRAWLDGRQHTLRGPALVTVPGLSAHGFMFSPDVQGHVFTVAEPHLAALLQPHAGLADAVMQLHGASLQGAHPGAAPGAAAALLDAAGALRDDTAGHADWRAAALDAALLRLAVAVARTRHRGGAGAGAGAGDAGDAARGADTPAPPRALAHVQRLRGLVDAQYRRQPGQAALAAQLGITPTQLNRACQQVLGHTAQAVLHARLLLQAQRELAYTNLAIKQIALELGFGDAAYFTRFFRRLAGTGPAAWREAQRGAA